MPCIALGTSNDELAGGIDVQICVITEKCESGLTILQSDFFQSLFDHVLHNQLVHFFHAGSRHLSACVASTLLAAHGLQGFSMLSGDHHGVNLQWLHRAICLLRILDGNLSLAIWAQPPQLATLAHIGELLAQASGHGMCQWHAILGLVASISKHDALIASANIHFVLAHMHSSGNVWALLVDANDDLASLV